MNGLNQKASEFPDSPGVYRFFKNKKILYIGKAKSLKKRVKTYFGKSLKEFKTQKLVNQITGMDFIETNNETEALLLEQNLIKTEQPPFNILLRDDKTFPYIELTEKHDFPGIFFKRTRKSEKNLFGPFTSASATRLAIGEIQKIFNLRTCNDVFFSNRSRACLQYQIGKCSGPCVGLIEKRDYEQDVFGAKEALKGNFSKIISKLRSEMNFNSQIENFEKAGEIKRKIEALKKVEETQIIFSGGDQIKVIGMACEGDEVSFVVIDVIKNSFSNIKKYSFKNKLEKNSKEITEEFISRLVLANPQIKEIVFAGEEINSPFFPHITFTKPSGGKKIKWAEMANRNARNLLSLRLQRGLKYESSMEFIKNNLNLDTNNIGMVGFDVSGGAGDIQTVSCVFFNSSGPDKSKYRFFRVPIKNSESDLEALLFGIKRYLKNNFEVNLILIDGGKTHLNYIKRNLKNVKAKFVSVGKGEKRKYGIENLFYEDKRIEFRTNNSISKIFLDLRDEAHRFALKNFRSVKRKNLTKHFLQDIDGIGPKTIDKIYKNYVTLENLTKYSAKEVSEELGLNIKIAEKIQTSLEEIYN